MDRARRLVLALVFICGGPLTAAAQQGGADVAAEERGGAGAPEAMLQRFDAYPHAVSIDASSRDVIDYEVGLGAIQKSRGAWKFKHSERLSGHLQTYTWQIVDGFTSGEVAEEISSIVESDPATSLLFGCESRACGPGVQWANRVFKQRLLYGQESMQRYRVYQLGRDNEYRLLVFNAARTSDRQYLHVELLRLQ